MTGQYKYKASPPILWKLSCIVKPKKRKYQHGSCHLSESTRSIAMRWTYLSKLPPIQKVTGIIFEDEDEVDLVFVPYATSEGEKKDQKVDEKEPSIDLIMSVLQL
jgi:hypothetical protein